MREGGSYKRDSEGWKRERKLPQHQRAVTMSQSAVCTNPKTGECLRKASPG